MNARTVYRRLDTWFPASTQHSTIDASAPLSNSKPEAFMVTRWLHAGLLISTSLTPCAFAADADLKGALEKVRAVGPKGEGHKEAIAAVKVVSQAGVGQLPQVLAAMDDASPLALNWLRLAVESIAQKNSGKLPADVLEGFVKDTAH